MTELRFDISVVVTAHSETVVAGPSLQSAEAAIACADEDGWRIERLIGLDRASEQCSAFFQSPRFSHWKKIPLDHGDLGLARNSLAKESRGKWIAFLDADDLFSENWLSKSAEILHASNNKSKKVILHPEMNLFFDASDSVLFNVPDTDELFTRYYWYFANYYDSLTIAPREAFLQTPYLARDRARGFGYEDWRWNLDTQDAGWSHDIVKNTIIFKRRQDSSLVVELGTNRSLLWDTEALSI